MASTRGNSAEQRIDPVVGTVSEEHPERSASLKGDLINLARGFCMGAADTVPGVSGGTVALILGHYQRLIGAVSNVDRQFVQHLRQGKLVDAWNHVDGRFLTAIGGGIGVGIVTLAGLMHWLLDHHMPQTFAVFFGLILASIVIVRRYIRKWTVPTTIACVIGIGLAITVGRLSPTDGSSSLIYLFASAAIAICAMILPGISGAFILLLLGVYHPITGLIKDAAKGSIDLTAITQIAVFGGGCLFGLLAFSKVLRWMLEHQRCLTMSALVGLMIGSVEKLWPLQVPTAETADLDMKERVMRFVAPGDWDGSLTLLILLAVASAGLVLLLDRLAPEDLVTDDETAG